MKFSLARLDSTMTTKRWQGSVQTNFLSGNHKTKSADLITLLLVTQTIETPQKWNKTVIVTKTQKEKVERDNSEHWLKKET